MTCYNRERYIATAIESVLASTYSNFELIILDDGSTDETVKIAKKYAAVDERIKVDVNETNLGDYPNRNKAASLARGKYIKYVGSDDKIFVESLQIFVESMENFPTAGVGFCSVSEQIGKTLQLDSSEAYRYHFFGPGLFYGGPLHAIIRKDAFDSLHGFNNGRMISDKDMWHQIALHFPVVVIPGNLVWKREHPEQELRDQAKFIFESEKIKWKYLLNPSWINRPGKTND